jgi:hypothetical protein
MKAFLAAIAAVFALAGCSSLPDQATEHGSVTRTVVKRDGSREVTENASDYAAYTKAKLELAGKPLFRLTCPTTGCVIASLEVSAPNSGGDLAAPAAPVKVEHAAVGIARELKETVLGLQPLAVATTVGRTVTRVFDSFGRSNEMIAARIQAPQPNVIVNGNNSAASAGGTAASTGPVATTTTNTTTTTTTTDSNNRTCSGGAAAPGGGTTTGGAGGSSPGGTC